MAIPYTHKKSFEMLDRIKKDRKVFFRDDKGEIILSVFYHPIRGFTFYKGELQEGKIGALCSPEKVIEKISKVSPDISNPGEDLSINGVHKVKDVQGENSNPANNDLIP